VSSAVKQFFGTLAPDLADALRTLPLPSGLISIALLLTKRPVLRQIAGGLLAIFGALMILTALSILPLLPPIYEARALVKVHKEPATSNGMPPGGDTSFDLDSFSRAIETAQSKIVLFPVITNLNLTTRYASKFNRRNRIPVPQAYRILKQHLRVEQYRSTSLIEIRADSTDRYEAAKLAHAIALAFRDHMLEQRRITHQLSIAALEKKLRDGDGDPNGRKAELLNHLRAKAAVLTSPVEIMSSPDAPTRPSRPARSTILCLFVGGFLLVLLGIGAGLATLGRKNV
jgi:uncharacterized protein involved in exopolysaccharide biosynthesis